MLEFLGGPKVPKGAKFDQEVAFFVMKYKPLLTPLSHSIWYDNMFSKVLATFLQWENVLMN